MTERLYYHDSFVYEFDAKIVDMLPASAQSRSALLLDRTAFYPTSGGQAFDTGVLVTPGTGSEERRVLEVGERDSNSIVHFVDDITGLSAGTSIRGIIDKGRRRDHMQQHSGQHVLSAVFIKLFDFPTVSFHMSEDYCSIDLDAKSLSPQQVEDAERLANEVILEDRSVEIRFVSQDEAAGLGLRKLPPVERDKLRLIDIRDFDLTACGGTHVRSTGQIGSILLRKTEKVRQGIRVEFVCGQRAVKAARRDYIALSEAAGLYSTQLWDVPQQIRKTQEEAKANRRVREELLEELAQQHAIRIVAETAADKGRKIATRVFADRDLTFIKLLAQQLTRNNGSVVALLAATSDPPALVFAQSPGSPHDMGAVMRDALAKLGGRGGGTRDMAQGGPQNKEQVATVLNDLAEKLRSLHEQSPQR